MHLSYRTGILLGGKVPLATEDGGPGDACSQPAAREIQVFSKSVPTVRKPTTSGHLFLARTSSTKGHAQNSQLLLQTSSGGTPPIYYLKKTNSSNSHASRKRVRANKS